jgi:hypothetical protein
VLGITGYGSINPYTAAQSGRNPNLFQSNSNLGQNPGVYGSAPTSYQKFNLSNIGNWLLGNLQRGSYQPPTSPLVQQVGTPPGQPNSYVSPFAQKAGETAKAWQPAGLPSGVIPMSSAMQAGAADGLTNAQVAEQMKQAGFNQRYVEGVGMTWFPNTGVGTAQMGNLGAGDRPDYVDGASLQPGESVTDSSGNRWVGGTPTEDGTAQYALNVANPNAAKDTKGKYKWVSEVKKDKNGNWIRVNRQVLRKVYTRSHLKRAAERKYEQATPTQPSQGGTSTPEYNQLVNFRASFG